jgi:hypothetical protein
MKMKTLFALICLCATCHLFAAEKIVKEETTPPPAEGALTVDQLQPALTSTTVPTKTDAHQ